MNKKITTLVKGTLAVASFIFLQVSTADAQIQYLRSTQEPNPIFDPQNKPAAGPDAGVVRILTPFNKCSFGAAEDVTIEVQNFSTDSVLSNIPVTLRVATGTVITETIAGPIAIGAKALYTFTAKADLSSLATYTITTATALTGDVNSANNSRNVTVNESTPVSFDTTSIYTGFESTDIPALQLFDLLGNGDGIDWNFNERQLPRSGKASCGLFTGPAASDDWIFTKQCIVLAAGDIVDVSFWYAGNGIGASLIGDEKLEIRVGTGKTPAQMTTSIFTDTTFGGTTYRSGSGRFTAPAAGNYFIGFHGFTPGQTQGQGLINLDDIKIRKQSAQNVVVSAIKAPKTSCDFSSAETITVLLTNVGTQAASNIPVTMKPSKTSTITISDTYTGSIAPGQSVEFTFGAGKTLDISAGTSYRLYSTTDLAKNGEEFTQQITEIKAKTFPTNGTDLVVSFEEDEETTVLAGWDFQDTNSDSVTWITFRSPQNQAQTGARTLTYFSNGDNTLDGDDYAFSKCLTLDADHKYEIALSYKFGTNGGDLGGSFAITFGNDQRPDAHTELLILDGLDNADYALAEVTGLQVPENGNYYVGIRALTPANEGTLYIDDFAFTRNDASVGGVKFGNLDRAVRVFPNPSKDIVTLNVAFEQKQDATITITDILGNVVLQETRKGLLNDKINFDLSAQANGVYFVKVQNADLNIVKKVLISK